MDASANKFVRLDEDEAYAATSHWEWQHIAKQMENFNRLKIHDLAPDKRDCEICYEPLGVGASDNGRPMEEPVELRACGHVFGHVCLFSWFAQLMPLGRWWNWEASNAHWPWPSEDDFRANDEYEFREARFLTDVEDVSVALHEDGQRRSDWRERLNWNSDDSADLLSKPTSQHYVYNGVATLSCPKCRSTFTMLRTAVNGVALEARLRFWDSLYEKLGLSRSALEEESRNDLWHYVQMVQVPRTEVKPEHMRSFTLRAQVSAMRFALRRGNRALDPLQTYLRDAIFNLGCYGLHDDGEYDATSYETRKVPFWCFQIDRMKRGLDPIVVTLDHFETVLYSEVEFTQHENYSKEFYRDLKSQVSGPWRRSLFADVGGDRPGIWL